MMFNYVWVQSTDFFCNIAKKNRSSVIKRLSGGWIYQRYNFLIKVFEVSKRLSTCNKGKRQI